MANPNGMAEVGERIWRIINQIHPSNSYICAAGTPGECFLVDPELILMRSIRLLPALA